MLSLSKYGNLSTHRRLTRGQVAMPNDNPTPISQDELETKLNNGESLKGVVIGNADFSGCKFDKVLDFTGALIQGTINFKDCKFSGKAKVNFSKAQFFVKAKAYFVGTIFSNEAEVYFSEAKFSNEAQVFFSGAQFLDQSKAIFAWTCFSNQSNASFLIAKFSNKSGAYFSGAKFLNECNLYFSLAQFSDQARLVFSRAQFSGEAQADFSNAKFNDHSECLWVNTELSSQGLFQFRNMRCEDTANIRFESIDLSEASFYLTDIEGFTFKSITWRKFRKGFVTRSKLKDEDLFEINDSIKIIALDGNEKKIEKRKLQINYFRQVEILYRQLKRNYEEKRDYHGAGDFHFGELEMRRKQKTWWGQWTSLTLPYRLFSGYGEKWGRALAWFFITVFLFAGLNLLWIQPISTDKQTKATDTSKDQAATTQPAPNPPKTWEETHWTGKLVDSSLFTFKLMTLQRGLKYEAVDDPVWLGRLGKFVLNLEFLIGPTLIALMLLAIRRQFRR